MAIVRDDERPHVWVGHVTLAVSDVEKAYAWWEQLGMRPVLQQESFGILELRGGTHLILLPSEDVEAGQPAPFDVMVDAIDDAHRAYTERGLAPSEVERGKIHDSFTLTDPSGYVVKINSSHVAGVV